MNSLRLSLFGLLMVSQTLAARINNDCLRMSDKIAGKGVKADGDAFAFVNNAVQLSNTYIDDSERFFSLVTCTRSDGNLQLSYINLSADPYGTENASKVQLDAIGTGYDDCIEMKISGALEKI